MRRLIQSRAEPGTLPRTRSHHYVLIEKPGVLVNCRADGVRVGVASLSGRRLASRDGIGRTFSKQSRHESTITAAISHARAAASCGTYLNEK